MSKNNGANHLSETFHQFFHRDGILDIIAGATLMNFAFDILGNAETTSFLSWIPIFLLPSMKRQISYPRVASKFGEEQEKRARTLTIYISLGIVIAIVLLSLIILNDRLGINQISALAFIPFKMTLATAISLALALLVPAWLLGMKQYYLYSAVVFASGIVSAFFIGAYVPVFITSAVMVVLGTRAMTAFTRENPLADDNPSKESDE